MFCKSLSCLLECSCTVQTWEKLKTHPERNHLLVCLPHSICSKEILVAQIKQKRGHTVEVKYASEIEFLAFFLSLFSYRLCFRLVSFTWGLYPWASPFSEETHWTGTSPLGSCGLCRVCSVDECGPCFTVKLSGWENHGNQATVKSACNRFFLFLQSVLCPAQALCTNLMMIWLSWVIL